MKHFIRAAFVAFLYLATASASGFWQSRDSNYNISVTGGASCTPNTAYNNFDTRVNAARGSNLSGSDATAYCNIFACLVTAGAINSSGTGLLTDAIYAFAAPDTNVAKLNLVNNATYDATLTSSPTFTAYQGYTTDGSTNYVNSNFNPNTAAGLYAQDSASFGLWSYTAPAQSAATSGAGAGSQPSLGLNPRNASDMIRFAMNDAGSFINGGTNTTAGFVSIVRSTSTLVTVYKNGAATGSTGSTTSSGLPNSNIAFGMNFGATTFRADTFSFGVIGKAMNATQMSDTYNCLHNFGNAVNPSGFP